MMDFYRKIRLVATFYKSFVLVSFIITAICVNLFRIYGFSIFTPIFWFKITTMGVIYYFIHQNKRKEYYYYLNLGVSKILLWMATLSFDFALFLFLIIQINKLR